MTLADVKAPHVHYWPLYMNYLRQRSVRSIMELGVSYGRSLEIWMGWFPGASVVGVDISPTAESLALSGDRCKIVEADQCSPSLLELGKFDLIIDDASHSPHKQDESLLLLWPSLNPGGLYVIEDLETSYWPFVGGSSDTQTPPPPGQERVIEAWGSNRAIKLRLKVLADYLMARYAKQASEPMFPGLDGLEAIHFHPNIAFLEKAA